MSPSARHAAHPAGQLVDPEPAGQLLADWHDLAARARHANPFHGPDMLPPALRHLGGEDVRLLTVRDDAGRLALLLPVAGRRRHRRLPVRATTTWQHTQHFLGTPLVAPELGVDGWRTALERLARDGEDPWLVLTSLDADVARDVEAAAARTGRSTRRLTSVRRAVTHRDPTGAHPPDHPVDHPVDYVARQLPGKRRKELRRVWRRLDESVGGGLRVVDLAGAGRADEGVEAFLRLEAAGWKGADGGAIAHHADQRTFFVEACRALQARGALSVLALLAGDGSAVAVLVDVRDGDTVFTWKTAYDEQHAAHSPGLLLYLEQLRRFPDSGAALVDTCADPGHPMADRLHPDRRELVTLAVALRPGAGEWAVRTAPRLLETVDGVRHRWRARHDRRAADRTRAPTAATSTAPRTTTTSTSTAPTTPEEARP